MPILRRDPVHRVEATATLRQGDLAGQDVAAARTARRFTPEMSVFITPAERMPNRSWNMGTPIRTRRTRWLNEAAASGSACSRAIRCH